MARKSWHKDVSFTNPWDTSLRICADAEWEKRGSPDFEIRLQQVKVEQSEGECEGRFSLDIPLEVQEHTVHSTKTRTGYLNQYTTTVTSFHVSLVSETPEAAGSAFFPEAGQENVPRHSDL